MRCFKADLHIHTCLSPCAELTMSPRRIVEKARVRMLDIIGICDHNSAENVQATINAASERGICVFAGMEIASSEEVHVVGIFDKLNNVLKLQDIIYKNLPAGENKKELFGEQIIANEFDEVEGYNKRLLIGATKLTLKTLVDEIHNLGGLAIASHIDRESFSIIGQLGFIPTDLKLDAVEISPRINISQATERFPEIDRLPIISASDAHFLEDIGKTTTEFMLAEPTIDEIRKALRKKEGREIKLEK